MALNFLNNGYFAGKVGIGIQSPAAKLHVNPTTTDEIAIAINGTQNYSAGEFQRIAAGDASSIDRLSIGFGYDNPTDWAIRYSSYGRHEFYTGNDWGNAANTEKMVITSAGNVGIGTGSPDNLLHVQGSNNPRIDLGEDTNNKGWMRWNNADNYIDFTTRVGGTYYADTLVLRNGNVGIGTTGPTGKLTIADTAFTTAYNSIKGLFFDNSNISSGDENFGAGIEFGKLSNGGNLYKKAAIIPVQSGSDSDQMGISFFVSNTVSQASPVIEAMRVDYGGNVGIGTTSPSDYYSDNLVVKQATGAGGITIATDTSSEGALYFADGTSGNQRYEGGVGYNHSINKLFLVSGGQSRVFIDSTGNVGIGTISPGYKLDVTGDARFGDGNNFNPLIQYAGSGRVAASPGYSFVGDLDTGMFNPNLGNTLAFTTGGSERMRIDSNGSVSFGGSTTLSNTAASIQHFSTNGYLYIYGGTGGVVIGDDSTATRMQIQDNNDIWFETAGTERMRIANGGNVGIGTTSPTQKLHVAGNLRVTGAYYDSNNSSGTANQVLVSTVTGTDWVDGSAIPGVPAGSGTLNTVPLWTPDGDTLGNSHITQSTALANDIIIPQFVRHTSDTNTYFGFGLNDTINFGTSGSERMRITSGGNVGIGTTGPSSKLQVEAAAGQATTLNNSVANSALRINADTANGSNNIRIGESGSGSYFLQVSNSAGTTPYAINLNPFGGNVGIGTTSPSAKLEVTGNTRLGSGTFHVSSDATLITSSTYTFRDGVYINNPNSTSAAVASGNVMSIGASSGNTVFTSLITTGAIGIGKSNPSAQLDVVGTGNFTGLVSGITPVNAANFVTKAYVDGSGGGTGPFLPLAGGTMTAGAVVTFLASSGSTDDRLKFGASGQMQLFHDGSDGYIINSLGDVRMDVNTFRVRSSSGTETMIKATQNDNVELYFNDVRKIRTTSGGVFVEGEIKIDSALLDNQENTDVDTGTEAIASVVLATYTAAFFDFVIKKGTNVRSGTVYACHDGTSVAFTETSTQDLGDTSDVTLNVVISTIYLQLQATTTSDDWSIKSLIRAI